MRYRGEGKGALPPPFGLLIFEIIGVLEYVSFFWGGGKGTEEEPTACSGGPRMKFSQARFTGGEKIKYFIKKNKIFYKRVE
jgi:hypothetical protein